MKKKLTFIGLFVFGLGSVTLMQSCKGDTEGCTDPEALNYDMEAEVNDGSCEYDTTSTAAELPETYIVFDADTFYYSNHSIPPDNNAYRYNINFSTEAQLTQSGNDGQTESTLALALSFKEKPTASGSAPFSKSRFPETGSDSLNLYLSVFFNTGHTYEGENFLSPASQTFAYTIENGKLMGTLPALEMILESDQTQTVTLQGGNLNLDW